MATGTRQLEEMGGLAEADAVDGAVLPGGAAAISGLPLLNGFVSEWLLFQALLQGFAATPHSAGSIFPVAGALLALTSALAAACFVKAFGITFLALPRGEGAERRTSHRADARAAGLPGRMCVVLGLAPGWVLEVLRGVAALAAGSASGAGDGAGLVRDRAGPGHFDHLAPALVAGAVLVGLALALGDVAGGGLRGAAGADLGLRG